MVLRANDRLIISIINLKQAKKQAFMIDILLRHENFSVQNFGNET